MAIAVPLVAAGAVGGGAFALGASATAAIALGAGAFGAVTSIQSGQQQASLMKANAQAAEYNAQVARNNAVAARQWGDYEANRQAEKTRRMGATQEAMLAANGFVGGTGTPLEILADTAVQGELDRLAIKHQARVKEMGFEAEAVGAQYQAQIARYGAGIAKTTSYMNAGASLLQGAGMAYASGGLNGMFSGGAGISNSNYVWNNSVGSSLAGGNLGVTSSGPALSW